jgi:hypothetical protein
MLKSLVKSVDGHGIHSKKDLAFKILLKLHPFSNLQNGGFLKFLANRRFVWLSIVIFLMGWVNFKNYVLQDIDLNENQGQKRDLFDFEVIKELNEV